MVKKQNLDKDHNKKYSDAIAGKQSAEDDNAKVRNTESVKKVEGTTENMKVKKTW